MYEEVQQMCGGIWMGRGEVNRGLEGRTDKLKCEMLKLQLKARRYVFGEKNTDGILNVTEKGKAKSWEELKEQLDQIIDRSKARCEEVEKNETELVEILLAPDEDMYKFKEEMKRKRSEIEERCRKRIKRGRRVDYNDLVGKIVEHLTVDERGENWYTAFISSKNNDGMNFVYFSDTSTVYHYRKDDVINDMNCGDLFVKELSVTDLVGLKIRHRWEVDGAKVWFTGYVVEAEDGYGSEKRCKVEFKNLDSDNADDDNEFEELWEGALLEDYWKNDVRVIEKI